MVFISKITREQSKAIDTLQQSIHNRQNPTPKKNHPKYRHMQNIVDKWKRGEKL
jgi:hypothetical protein